MKSAWKSDENIKRRGVPPFLLIERFHLGTVIIEFDLRTTEIPSSSLVGSALIEQICSSVIVTKCIRMT